MNEILAYLPKSVQSASSVLSRTDMVGLIYHKFLVLCFTIALQLSSSKPNHAHLAKLKYKNQYLSLILLQYHFDY